MIEVDDKMEHSEVRCSSPGFERPNMSDLRIVLLGNSVSENHKARKLILGKDVVKSEAPAEKLQQHSERVEGRLKDKHVIIINSPQLLQKHLSLRHITQTVRECVYLSDPGPHVFILVLQHNDFTEEDRYRVKSVLKEFSEKAIERTIVLTSDEETYRSMFSSMIKNNAIHQLIKECGGGHLQLDERNSELQSKILQSVNKIHKGNLEEYLTCVKIRSVDEGQIRSDDSVRSEAENKERSHKDGKPKEGKAKRSNEASANLSRKEKLNLVLCGSDTTLTVSVYQILHQRVCSEDVELHGRLVSLVDLPALNQLSEEEVKRQTLRCVSLCDPGVHVFLLIIPDRPLNIEDKAEIEKIQRIFDSREHFMVLFTTEMTVEEPVINFAKSIIDSESLCGGRYSVMGLKEPENSRQIPELLDYIENMKTEPYSLQMYMKAQENRVRHELDKQHKEELKRMENEINKLKQKIQSEGVEGESDDQKCLRIVLIGRTGSGKSATGNTILGREEFHSQLSTDSVTTVCKKGVGKADSQLVTVVDTPGLFDTTLTKKNVVEEIVKCVSLSSPGPHVFVIVLHLGRITREEVDTIDLIKKIFGPKAAQFSIVLFTRGDDLENESIQDYMKRSNSAELKKLIRDCGNRFLAFNNREKQNKTQVIQLLNMIEEVKKTNEGRYFTNSMFEEAEMSIKRRMEEILKERETEIQTQREELQAKYEMEMKIMMKRLKEEKQRADEKRMKMENQFREKEEKLRKEFDEKEKIEQKKREIENQKRSEEEKQQRVEYHQKIEEMKRESENQRSQYEKQQKEREKEERKREEKYRKDQEKMRKKQEHIIAELQLKQDEEKKSRDLEEKRRNELEEIERQKWTIKIKEAENYKKTQEEIKQQQRKWEDEKKRQMRERNADERKRKERHEEQLRKKQEELDKLREKFESEREEERQNIEDERQKQRKEREKKEREYKDKKTEMKKHYEQLEQERKVAWERQIQEDEERREKERQIWRQMFEDLKQKQGQQIKEKEEEDRKRKETEEEERDEMKREYEGQIITMKKKYQDEARKQAEELNDLRERKDELQQNLEEHQKQLELLKKLHQHLKNQKEKELKELQFQKGEEIKELLQEVEKLKNKPGCVIL